MRKAALLAGALGLALGLWLVSTAAFCAALLRWGRGWSGVAHALLPAAVLGGATTFVVAAVVGATAYVLRGSLRNMARAAPVLDAYLARYRADGTFGPPQPVLGLTWRYRGKLRGVPVSLDFTATELRVGWPQPPAEALELPFAVTLVALSVTLPPGTGDTGFLARDLERRFPPLSFVALGGRLELNCHVPVTDPAGGIVFPAARLEEALEAAVDGVRDLGGGSRDTA